MPSFCLQEWERFSACGSRTEKQIEMHSNSLVNQERMQTLRFLSAFVVTCPSAVQLHCLDPSVHPPASKPRPVSSVTWPIEFKEERILLNVVSYTYVLFCFLLLDHRDKKLSIVWNSDFNLVHFSSLPPIGDVLETPQWSSRNCLTSPRCDYCTAPRLSCLPHYNYVSGSSHLQFP